MGKEGAGNAGSGRRRRGEKICEIGKKRSPYVERGLYERPREGAHGVQRGPQKRWPNTAILHDLCAPSTRAHTRCYVVLRESLVCSTTISRCSGGKDITRNVLFAKRIYIYKV